MAVSAMRREAVEHTLQTMALVHEAYLRICRSAPIDWHDRAHFYAVAAQQLRRVLVDHARRRHSEKRGGEVVKLSLWESDGPAVASTSACWPWTRRWRGWSHSIRAPRRSWSYASLAA